jgi:hypothetical protein
LEDGYLTATVPVGAKTGSVVVRMPSGDLTGSVVFKVAPRLTSFSPPSGPVAMPVMIRGTGLTQTTKVTLGGVKATTLTVNSDALARVLVVDPRVGLLQARPQGNTRLPVKIFLDQRVVAIPSTNALGCA